MSSGSRGRKLGTRDRRIINHAMFNSADGKQRCKEGRGKGVKAESDLVHLYLSCSLTPTSSRGLFVW